MHKYLDAVHDVLHTGQRQPNRTGIDTLFKHGLYLTFDMADGFPLVTTKAVNWKSCFAEMLGFWCAYDDAADFRELGTNVWNQNANENKTWLSSIARKGHDDLGRIYGVQAREWDSGIDQLAMVYEDLKAGIDNRREIVTHWNPAELSCMALPPCHLFYQFGLRRHEHANLSTLDLFIYIRSNDMGLGMPFNIAGYAWLLHVMAQITGHIPGRLHYFAWNYHIYTNHIEPLTMQAMREPYPLPTLSINPDIKTLDDMDTWVTVADFEVTNYKAHPPIKMEMAV